MAATFQNLLTLLITEAPIFPCTLLSFYEKRRRKNGALKHTLIMHSDKNSSIWGHKEMMDREVTDYGAGTLLPGSATSMEKTM
jgi:hypothetical protein